MSGFEPQRRTLASQVGSRHVGDEERVIVMTLLARIRLLIVTIALLSIAAAVSLHAQKRCPDAAPNPTASVFDQKTLLNQAPRTEGRRDIPPPTAPAVNTPSRPTPTHSPS